MKLISWSFISWTTHHSIRLWEKLYTNRSTHSDLIIVCSSAVFGSVFHNKQNSTRASTRPDNTARYRDAIHTYRLWADWGMSWTAGPDRWWRFPRWSDRCSACEWSGTAATTKWLESLSWRWNIKHMNQNFASTNQINRLGCENGNVSHMFRLSPDDIHFLISSNLGSM